MDGRIHVWQTIMQLNAVLTLFKKIHEEALWKVANWTHNDQHYMGRYITFIPDYLKNKECEQEGLEIKIMNDYAAHMKIEATTRKNDRN